VFKKKSNYSFVNEVHLCMWPLIMTHASKTIVYIRGHTPEKHQLF